MRIKQEYQEKIDQIKKQMEDAQGLNGSPEKMTYKKKNIEDSDTDEDGGDTHSSNSKKSGGSDQNKNARNPQKPSTDKK